MNNGIPIFKIGSMICIVVAILFLFGMPGPAVNFDNGHIEIHVNDCRTYFPTQFTVYVPFNMCLMQTVQGWQIVKLPTLR